MELSHFDKKGNARMVDISHKPITNRKAIAKGAVLMNSRTINLIKEGSVAKGDVLSIARIAGIMAAKKVSGLIPLCHPISLSSVSIEFFIDDENKKIEIETTVTSTGQTGVEMEALTGTTIAALTIYDMCKAIDKGMVISDIMLIEKEGGRSGYFKRQTIS
ncbi:MAG: cyclic pyranopterin monophosphate synthase MoaC [Thermodesulfovibrionales bacterium]|nr:cyclic pyranopterin monophosphate synthase MoaC [Thermodesulfovibrionales bacterium]